MSNYLQETTRCSTTHVGTICKEGTSHDRVSWSTILPYRNVLYIREYGSTLYVGLARAVSPTNTKFRLTFLLT